MPASTNIKLLFIELNEAEQYFFDKLEREGRLPTLARLRRGGVFLRTHIPQWKADADKAWRAISPWIIWPSVYTGMPPDRHGIVGFGQDSQSLRGRCVWDVLDRAGVSIGIFGSLMSYPPRNEGAARFYVPESLADDPACFPAEARPVQEFCVFSARNYSESFSTRALKAILLLLNATRGGVRLETVLRTLGQVPSELMRGASVVPERAMLHSYICADAFKWLYQKHRPSYATLHLNHIAYMQHRYWRAAEPDRFSENLSATDSRFFRSVEERRAYEQKFAHWIEKSFTYTDALVSDLLQMVDDSTIVLIASGLGQRPMDPVDQIHNPVVRLVHEDELFSAIGLRDYKVMHQMNPDVTVNFRNEISAGVAAAALERLYVRGDEPFFVVQRRGAQVFLELNMPCREKPDEALRIRHRTLSQIDLPIGRYIREHATNDQSTAHHKDTGWLLAFSKGFQLISERKFVPVTDIAPTVLSLYGLHPQPWMEGNAQPAFHVATGA
jgi:hypothetical protein